MKNRNYESFLVIKRGIEGLGVFTLVDIDEGEVLFQLKGEVTHAPTRTSVQIGNETHVEDPIGSHINHSCRPNAKVNQEEKAFVSVRKIYRGEEITFDYKSNETQIAAPFHCSCCGRRIS